MFNIFFFANLIHFRGLGASFFLFGYLQRIGEFQAIVSEYTRDSERKKRLALAYKFYRVIRRFNSIDMPDYKFFWLNNLQSKSFFRFSKPRPAGRGFETFIPNNMIKINTYSL
jgi:hypothetical protein